MNYLAKIKAASVLTGSKRDRTDQQQFASGGQEDFADLWRPDETGSDTDGPHRWLVDEGLVTAAQIDQGRKRQAENKNLSLLESLVQIKAIDRLTAQQAVAGYFKFPFLRLCSDDVDQDIFALLPLEYLKDKVIVPVSKSDGRILVALADPADIFLIDDIKRRLGPKVRLAVSPSEDIVKTLEETSAGVAQQVEEIIRDISEDAVEVVDNKDKEVTDLEKIAGESPVIRYVNYLISSAVRDGASDIHIEPAHKHLKVRCRIDGVLFAQQAPPISMHAAIISRLKIMSNLDIAERRLPQDGRIRVVINGRSIDLRVSTLPVCHGEKCVIRILDNRSISIGLENLGMDSRTHQAFREQILQPHGIVLVTGPTGSGKSTTLYSALQIMDSDRMNISTVEDPVEYELSTINQVHVHDSIGMTFSAALRSLLRQDPDIIMIGEIRDGETARIAVQASLTGHLVLSTLHTNDAPSSITRLINIGVEPYLIGASLNAILAQRLVRRICDNCKQPITQVKPDIKAWLRSCGVEDVKLYRGAGCDKCRQTGYKGRVGIYELLEMDDGMRDMLAKEFTLNELRSRLIEKGMRTMHDDGLEKVIAGFTTVEELMRITQRGNGDTNSANTVGTSE